LLFLVCSVPDTGQNGDDDYSNGSADCSGDEYRSVYSVIVVAVVILRIAIVVPFGAVSVVIAALPGAVLELAVLVISHNV
jgi:hypothetical protein